MTYESKALDGQSANDLDPDAPQNVNAIWTGNYVYLTITPPGVMPPDFSYYNVYRTNGAGPVLIGTTPDEQYTDDSANPDMDYCYHATVVDDAGNESEDSETECVNAVPSGAGDTPAFATLEVFPNMPNPFSQGTTLRLGLPQDASVRVEVFDVAGRRVIARDVGTMSAGLQSLRLSGRSDRGALLPSGVYFYRVTAAGVSTTRKMVVQR